MKPLNYMTKESFSIKESHSVRNTIKRIKKILDAEYKKINLVKIVTNLDYLKNRHKDSLLKLLEKYKNMFDGNLSNYIGSDYTIELKEYSKPYHAKPFPIPTIHESTLKKEGQRLVKIGVLQRMNNSQWAAPTFVIHK